MTDFTNPTNDELLYSFAMRDGDTLTTKGGSKWIWQGGDWRPLQYSSGAKNQLVTATPSGSGVAVTGVQVKDGAALKRVGTTFAVLGDSRGFFGFGFSPLGVLYTSSTRGWAAWANYYLGGPWVYVQTPVMAVAGETTAQWADGHAALMALSTPVDWLHITYPSNDIGVGVDPAITQANLLSYITDHLKRGSIVSLEQAGVDSLWDTAKRAKAGAMNDWIKATAASLGLTVIDRMTPTCDQDMLPVSPYYYDAIHESTAGCHKQGYYAAKLIGPHFARPCHFTGSPWRQAVYNPRMSGGTTLPVGWTAQGSGGTYSKVARTDGPNGDWARCVATAASEAQSVGFRQQIYLNQARVNSLAYNNVGWRILAGGNHYIVTTAGTSGAAEPTWNTEIGATTTDGTVVWTRVANIVPGVTRARMRAEAIVSSTGGGAYPRISFSFTPATGDVIGAYALFPASGDTLPSMMTLTNGPTPVLTTPDFIIPAGTTSVDVYALVTMANGATATLDFGAVWLEHIE